MNDLDVLLSIIENPTRRKILESLVREPNYPLRLSKELQLSQQAIMKHLKILEESEFVRSRPEESDRGGPTRKIYSPTSEFTMIVDVGPGLFNVEIVTPEYPGIIEDQMSPSFEIQEKMTDRGFKQEIDRLKGDISGVDRELDDLHVRRAALIKLKEKTLEKARRYVETNVNDNQIRRIVIESIKNPSLSSQELGRELGIREEIVIDLLEEVDAIGGKKDGRED